ncbi:hypothetical protein PAF17_05015 [Paracoccus sp. Z330]|uniref:Phage tail protein n=1 Tax=Paracoccus onchidii TaxID=3017813 RepID=A0ABT4ZCK0_9RHOB|nr:hypothetical protein [Paracoccus onchidii]MDB6176867.1 hypothetical protein [Paracoccus onchidii]
MKKPEDTKSASNNKASEPPQPGTTEKKPAESAMKSAAKPGTLNFKDVGSGDGSGAMAGGGKIKSAESTLVGQGEGGRPAAMPKPKDASRPDTDSASAPSTDRPGGDMHAATSPAPGQDVIIRKTGFWPVVLGGVVAAGIGSAATIWALPHLPAGWLPATSAPAPAPAASESIDVDAIAADAVARAEQAARQQIDALRDELAAAPQPEETPPAEPAPDSRIDEILTRLEQQGQRIEDLAAQPGIDPDVAARVQSLADKATALEGQIASAAESAQSTIAAAQAEAQKLQEAAAESTRRAEAVAAIASLKTALDRGVTAEQARSTLESAGLDAPEALTREVPSLGSLQDGFGDAARAALRASLRSDSAGGGNPITNFLRAQTGARSVAPREGDDPDAILSRAGAMVEAGDIPAALTQLADLPEAALAAPAMADWLTGATAYQDAYSALSDLSATSN